MEEIIKEKAETKTKLTDKEKEKIAREKEKQKEKERLAREKEKQKEKERLAREKEKQKEKERLAREKEKQKEKERLAREKEKQKEKERLAREKEKQKAKTPEKKQIVLTPKAGVEAKPLVSRTVPEAKSVVTLSDEVDEKELAQIKENESKDSLNKMQAIMEARQKLNSGVLDKPASKEGKIKLGKIVLDDEDEEVESAELQALKSRSNAQKALENDFINKKDNDLKAKLREASAQFGGMGEDEEPREKPQKLETSKINDAKVEMLQAQIDDLEENLEVLNEALDNAEALEFEGVRVCDPDTFELSEEFIEYVNRLKGQGNNNQELQELNSQIKLLEEEKNANQEIIANLEEEIKAQNTKLEKEAIDHSYTKEALDSLKEEKTELVEKLQKLEDENQKLVSSINSLDEKASIADSQEATLKETIASINQEKERLEIKVNELENENQKLSSEVSSTIQSSNSDQQALQVKIEELEEKLKVASSEIETLEATHKETITKLEESAKDEVNGLRKKEESLHQELALLTEKNKAMQDKLDEASTLEASQTKLDESLKEFINKCNSLTVDKANLNTKLEEKENELNSLKNECSLKEAELNEKLAESEKEKMELTLKVSALNAELEAKNAEETVKIVEDVKEEKIEEKPSKLKLVGKFFIDSFNGMAHGLFATLIIGVIISQIGGLFKEGTLVNESLTLIGTGLKLLMGVGIGVGIARSLKLDGIKLIAVSMSGGVCAYLQAPQAFGSGADPLTIYIVVVLTYLVIKYLLRKPTPVDVIIVPLIAGILSGVLTLLIGDYVKLVTTGIGALVNEATTLNPLPYGIIVSVIMGMCLTAPISSAAIAISIGLEGLAAGAAVVGCATQMVGFAIQSIRDNNIGKVVSVGIGTSMLQFKNILKRPIVWLPTIVASAILGPIATLVFHLECSPSGAGMGTSGLVGVLQVFDVMGYNANSILGVILLMVVAPAGLVFLFDLILRKLNLIKPGDLEI